MDLGGGAIDSALSMAVVQIKVEPFSHTAAVKWGNNCSVDTLYRLLENIHIRLNSYKFPQNCHFGKFFTKISVLHEFLKIPSFQVIFLMIHTIITLSYPTLVFLVRLSLKGNYQLRATIFIQFIICLFRSHIAKINIDQNCKIHLQSLDIWCKNVRRNCRDLKKKFYAMSFF